MKIIRVLGQHKVLTENLIGPDDSITVVISLVITRLPSDDHSRFQLKTQDAETRSPGLLDRELGRANKKESSHFTTQTLHNERTIIDLSTTYAPYDECDKDKCQQHPNTSTKEGNDFPYQKFDKREKNNQQQNADYGNDK